MSTSLFAFDEPAQARRAVAALHERGVPADAVQLHLPKDSPGDQATAAADEQLTGGLVTNVLGLFGEMFEWGSLPIDASPYAAIVRRGGAVVSIDAGSHTGPGPDSIDEVMTGHSPTLSSGWFEHAR